MKPNISAFVACAAIALALIGCQKQTDAPKPVTSDSGAAPASASASTSVAAPTSALPPSDATVKATAGPAGSDNGNANFHTQATPKELDKTQEAGAMPLSGQVNNHSTPATTGENK